MEWRIHMPIRLSGLSSGLDTESIVAELMSAQRLKSTKVENKQTKLEWKQEKWEDLNKKLYSFRNGSLYKMTLEGSYMKKKVTSSNENAITATATSAANGSHRVKINQLASAQYVTSGKIESSALKEGASTSTISAKTKLSDLTGMETGTTIIITNGEGKSDKTQKLEVTSTTTIDDFVTACNKAGLKANFDDTQKRLFISSPTSGGEKKFTIRSTSSSNYLPEDLTEMEQGIVNLVDYYSLSEEEQNKIDDAIEKINLSEEYSNYDAAKTVYEEFKEYYDGLDSSMQEVEKDSLEGYKKEYEEAEDVYTKKVLALDENTKKLKSIVKETAIANAALTGLTEEEITQKLEEIIPSTTDNSANSPLLALGLGEITGEEVSESSNGLVVRQAQDAEIELDGAKMTSTSNNMIINGMTLNLKEVTDYEVTIGVETDVDAVYDMVKDFIKEYNGLLKEMNDLYYADRAKGYEPLTDEQKEAMTDDQVEKWENKIKDSLFRRDDTLNSLLSSMRNNMTDPIKVNGKAYSLGSLGIETASLNFEEKGILHIHGDSEDTEYFDKDDKLKTMITEDPDTVMAIMRGLTKNLYDDFTKKMAKTSLSSSMTFYNDVQIKNELRDYKSELKTWEDKLEDMEEKYYRQFTAMEKAMAQLNSQSSSLASLLGTSTNQ